MESATQPSPYDFGGRLTADFPSQVIVDVTEVCNLACIHCPHPGFKKTNFYDGRMLEPELNAKMVDEVKEHGGGRTQYVRYTSEGEPLAHPAAYDMIQYAVQHSGTFVTLTTNGTIMNAKRTQKLLDSGVHMIDISIDAFRPETYAKIRVNGKLETTRKNVQNLIKWAREAGRRTKVVVSYVEQPLNTAETVDFEHFWKDEGADFVVVRRLHSAAGAVIKVADIMRAENLKLSRRPCLYPWERVVLNPRGFLSFCPADWNHGSTMVDFRTNSIRDTWTGPMYGALRSAHLTNQYAKHGFCGQCPDWKSTMWPSQGRSYADLVAEMQQ